MFIFGNYFHFGDLNMAGKNSGRTGTTECRASQKLPSGVVAEGAKSGSIQPSGGGLKSHDAKETKARANQSLPKGFSEGGQGAYPKGPCTTRDYHGTQAQPNQHLPIGHVGADNVSQGKSTGAVRGADAYQGPRHEQADPSVRKPGG